MKKVIMVAMVVFIGLDLIVLIAAPKARDFNAPPAIAAPAFKPLAIQTSSQCLSIDQAVKALEAARSDLQQAPRESCEYQQAAIEAADHAVTALQATQSCTQCVDK
jgi:hypothetical protein